MLRAVMHGYYIDVRLYQKARLATGTLDKEAVIRDRVKNKIRKMNEKTALVRCLYALSTSMYFH